MNDIVKSNDEKMVSFIEKAASDPSVDIEKFERLIALQNQERDRQAHIAYNADMALLQSEMPTISESGEIKVNNVVRSKYARYEDIVKAVRPLFAKYGFFFTAKTDFEDGMLIVEGSIGHKQGHHETTKMRLPFDNSGSKNSVQAIGSSVSYGKRYVISMLLNIATGGEDDDAMMSDHDALLEVRSAQNLDQLKIIFERHFRENQGNKKLIKELIDAKDQRKKEL